MKAGQLDFVLTADSSQLQQELREIRQESESTALAITGLFNNDLVSAVGFKVLHSTLLGVVGDIDEINQGLTLSESLTRNFTRSFEDLGDIALVELGQIAKFLGEDLFVGPLAAAQADALNNIGLGQLAGAFQVVSAGANAAKIAIPVLEGIGTAFEFIDSVLGDFEAKARGAANFFGTIAGNAQTLRQILQAVADVIDETIERLISSLAAVNPAFGAVVNVAQRLGISFSVGRSLLGQYIDDLDRVKQTAAGVSQTFDQTANATGKLRAGISSADQKVGSFTDNLKSQRQAAEELQSAMQHLGEAGFLFDSWQKASEIQDRFFGNLEDSFNAAKAAENLANRLNTVSGSAGGAAEDLQFLSNLTQTLGTNFDASAEGYARLSAATQQTALRGEKTKQIFQEISQATAVMRLSADDTKGVFLALGQSLSGGTVQLEELNQLSERIPGTFQAAAAALGVTTAELKGLISTGKVASEDFIPKFTAQLAANTKGGVLGASQGAEAAVNRFQNSLGNLQVAMGKTWIEVGTPALNTFSSALDFAAKNEELFSTAIDAILLASIPQFIAAMASATKAVLVFITTNKQVAISLFGRQIQFTAKQVAGYAAQIALAYAATIVFYRILDRIESGAKEFQTSIQSIEASLIDLQKATDATQGKITQIFPDKPPPTDWFDSLISKWNEFNEGVNEFFGVPKEFGNITTNAEKQLNDIRVAIGDLSVEIDKVFEKSINLRLDTKNGSGPIQDIKQINSELEKLRDRKLSVDPKDEKAVKSVLEEETKLLERKAAAQKQIATTQAAINNAIQQVEQRLKGIDPSKLGAANAAELKEQLQTQLNQLQQEKKALDDIANASTKATEKIAKDFENLGDKLNQSFTQTNVKIAEEQAKGLINEEEVRKKSLANEEKYLQDKLALNLEELNKLKTELEQNEKLKKIDPKTALSGEEEEKVTKRVKQLELETAQNRIELANKVVAAKKAAEEQIIKDFETANSEAKTAIEMAETDRISAIRQSQLEGKVTEEQAAQEIEKIRSENISKETAQIQAQVEKIRELRQRGVLSAEEANKRELEANQQLGQLNLQRIEQELKIKEDARQRELEAIQQANAQAKAAIETSTNQRIVNAKRLQAQGKLSAEETAKQIEQIEAQSIQQRITQTQKELSEVESLRQRGVLTEKEAIAQQQQLQKQSSDLIVQQVDREVKAREDANRKALESIKQANAEAEAAIEESTSKRILSVKKEQAEGRLSAEEAARSIEQVEAQSAQRRVTQIQKQLTQVDSLRQRGLLTEQEAADKRRDLQRQLTDFAIEQADREVKAREEANRKILDNVEKNNNQIEAAIERSTNARILAVKQAQLSGAKTEEQATAEIERIRQDAAAKEIQQIQSRVAQNDNLVKQGVRSEKEGNDIRLQLLKNLDQKEIDLVDQKLQARKRLQEASQKAAKEEGQSAKKQQQELSELAKKAKLTEENFEKLRQAKIRAVDRNTEQSKSSLEGTTNDQIIAIKQLQSDKQITEEEAAKRIEQLKAESTNREVEIVKDAIAKVQELRKQGFLTEGEALSKQTELQKQLGQLNLQRIDNEIAAQKRLKDEAIKAIEERAAADKLRSDGAINSLENEKRRLGELVVQQDQITRTFLESNRELAKSREGLAAALGNVKLDDTSRALEIRTRLDTEENLAAPVRQQLENELSGLGFSGQNQEQILRQQQQIENEIAQQRIAARQAEQQYAEQTLELEIRSADFAARRAYFEAQVAAQKAEQVAKQAEYNLQVAQQGGNQQEISKAKQELQFARENIDLEREGLGYAQLILNMQDELAAKRREGLANQQKAVNIEAEHTEKVRQRAQALKTAETNAKALGKAESKKDAASTTTNSGAASPVNSGRDMGGYTLIQGSKEWEQERRATESFRSALENVGNQKQNLLNMATGVERDNPWFLKKLETSGFGNIAQLASQMRSTNTSPLDMAMKQIDAKISGSGDLSAEFRNLGDKIEKLANRPSVGTLQVSSPAPVNDSMKIMRDMTASRGV